MHNGHMQFIQSSKSKGNSRKLSHTLNEFTTQRVRNQHTKHPTQTRLSKGRPLRKLSTATQPRTSFLQFIPEPRVLTIDQLPLVDIFNGYLISYFMIWFPLAVTHFYGYFYLLLRLFSENLTFLSCEPFTHKSIPFSPARLLFFS